MGCKAFIDRPYVLKKVEERVGQGCPTYEDRLFDFRRHPALAGPVLQIKFILPVGAGIGFPAPVRDIREFPP